MCVIPLPARQYPRSATQLAGGKDRLLITIPKRAEHFDSPDRTLVKLTNRDAGIHPAARDQIVVAELPGRGLLKCVAERWKSFSLDCKASGVLMPTELSQMLGAFLERLEEVKTLDASGRSTSESIGESNHYRRPMKSLDHARGDDSDYPGMPAIRSQYQSLRPGPSFLRLKKGSLENFLLNFSTFAVRCVQGFGEAPCLGGALTTKQPEPDGRVVKATRGVDSRRQAKTHRAGAHLRVGGQPRDLLEGPDSWPFRTGEDLQAVLHQNSVGSRG